MPPPCRDASAADPHHHPRAGDRPRATCCTRTRRELQSFELAFGEAHVFYPEADAERCTAALLLDVDPVGLVRGRAAGGRERPLDAVRQRPALRRLVVPERRDRAGLRHRARRPQQGAARSWPRRRSRSRPASPCCPCRGGEAVLRRLFEPLGYAVDGRRRHPLDAAFPEWGDSRYFTRRRCAATCRLARPARAPLRAGPGARRRQALLGRRRRGREAAAPRRGLAGRAPGARADRPPLPAATSRSLAREALEPPRAEEDADAGRTPRRTRRRRRRRSSSRSASTSSGSRAVLAALQAQRRAARARPRLRRGPAAAAAARRSRSSPRSSGMDVSLPRAGDRRRPPAPRPACRERQRERIELLHGSLIYRDARLDGLRRRRRGRGHRAPRPAAAGGLRARAVRVRAAGARSSLTTPNARVQRRASRRCPAGTLPPPRPPLRVDPRRVPRPGPSGVAERFGYAVRFAPVGAEDAERRRADADGGVHADERMTLTIPELSLVVLDRPVRLRQVHLRRAGTSSRPRSLSSDSCRGLVSDDENDQAATDDAFEVLHFIAGKRLARGRLTVVDATNVQPEARKPLVELAREYHVPAGRDRARPARAAVPRAQPRRGRTATSAPHVVRSQRTQLRRSLRGLQREGFRHVYVLRSPEEVEAADDRARAAVERPPRRARPVRHHRRRPRLLRRAGGAARRSWATRCRPDDEPAARAATRRPQGGLPRRPGRPRPRHRPTCCAW